MEIFSIWIRYFLNKTFIGIPPTKFQERIVSAELNKDFSSTIHFKNPFKENICVTVYMEADKES